MGLPFYVHLKKRPAWQQYSAFGRNLGFCLNALLKFILNKFNY